MCNKWIKVEDRLPREGERVEIFTWSGNIYIAYHLAGIRQWTSDNGFYYHGDSYGHVTRWKPLEPPEVD